MTNTLTMLLMNYEQVEQESKERSQPDNFVPILFTERRERMIKLEVKDAQLKSTGKRLTVSPRRGPEKMRGKCYDLYLKTFASLHEGCWNGKYPMTISIIRMILVRYFLIPYTLCLTSHFSSYCASPHPPELAITLQYEPNHHH